MKQRQFQYFKRIFNIFKSVAFHEIYMESGREDLCKNQYYDPLTAFKSMDAFRHNQIIPYELKSFFDLHQIESTYEECQQIIKSLNKSLTHLQYENFQELTLPQKTTLRNLAQTRYKEVKIIVGSYNKLCYVKEHSQHQIALFLEKQLNFCRNNQYMIQQFCRDWGGDIYSLLQKLFTKKEQQKIIQFDQFRSTARNYQVLFNKDEFTALWRRSKNINQYFSDIVSCQTLKFDNLITLLLTNNLKTKKKYGMERNIPIIKSLQIPKPSYKKSHWQQHEKWKRAEQKRQLQAFKQESLSTNYKMRYRFAYPQFLNPNLHSSQKLTELNKKVEQMSDRQLLEAYFKVATKKTIIHQ